jgi:hypothetical protein
MSALQLLSLMWCVFVANREQCGQGLWSKVKLVADEVNPARSFAAFVGPYKHIGPSGHIEAVFREPASLQQLLKEGVHVGSHLVCARLAHRIENRDSALLCASKNGKAARR